MDHELKVHARICSTPTKDLRRRLPTIEVFPLLINFCVKDLIRIEGIEDNIAFEL